MGYLGSFLIFAGVLMTGRATLVENAKSVYNEILPFRMAFDPPLMDRIPMDEERPVKVFYQDTTADGSSHLVLGVQVMNTEKAEVVDPLVDLIHVEEFPGINANVNDTANMTASGNFTLRGVFLGFTELTFHVCNRSRNLCNDTDFPTPDEKGKYISPNSEWVTLDIKYRVSVMRPRTALDDAFTAVVSIAVFISQIAIGCKTEIKIIKDVLKRPIAPIIGFCCQFCIMPPVAFGIGKLVPITPGQAVGLFAIGVSPGGGSSNMYTYLLLGDVSLSITMTLISTIASLGMIPLWMFTLGKLLLDQLGMGNVTVPFENIILSLVMVIIPVSIGLIIKHKKPVAAKKIAKITRPFMAIFLIFMFTFGIYVNYYMFKLFTGMVVLAGFILPLCGFFGGAAVSAICRQPWKRVKTIALETGIQNTGVAILMLLFSLPSPDAEMAIVGSIAATMFTPIAPLFLVVFYEIRRCRRKRKARKNSIDGEKGEAVEEEHVGLAIYMEKFKRVLPCLKKAEKADNGANEAEMNEKMPDDSEMKKDIPAEDDEKKISDDDTDIDKEKDVLEKQEDTTEYETKDPEHETKDPEHETKDPKHETKDPEHETKDPEMKKTDANVVEELDEPNDVPVDETATKEPPAGQEAAVVDGEEKDEEETKC